MIRLSINGERTIPQDNTAILNLRGIFSRTLFHCPGMAAVYLLLVICPYLLQSSMCHAQTIRKVEILPATECDEQVEEDEEPVDTLETIYIEPPECKFPYTCGDILYCNPYASSGYYQFQDTGSWVYCDMEGIHCGGEGGWMRVAHLNMTDPSSQCPDGFRLETANNTRFCIRNTNYAGCRSMLFETFGTTYTQVCGFVRGYSYFEPDGFRHNCTVDNLCVEGVTITYGTPTTHLWSYVASYEEAGAFSCIDPATNSCSITTAYSQHYYCESGTAAAPMEIWYTNDPLWDGKGCGEGEKPCCENRDLPWFTTYTEMPTLANLNAWVCLDEGTYDENIGVERLELYIK